MAQSLFEERFKLKLHREHRRLAVAVLIVGKAEAKNLTVKEPDGAPLHEPADRKVIVKNFTMQRFAMFLGNSPPYGVNEKVVDLTGISGSFDITVDVKAFDISDPRLERVRRR
jgi:uncharacterized protein (TIGR03435 family)